MSETMWINAVSDNSVRRTWDLRRALKSRNVASAIVIAGDYETKIAIDRANKDVVRNLLSTFNHKMLQKNVKRPKSSQAHCGWYVDEDYMLFHFNKCERCKNVREPYKEVRAEVGQRVQHEINTLNDQNSQAEITYRAIDNPVLNGKDFYDGPDNSLGDKPSTHYMRKTVPELEELMEGYIEKAAVIESVIGKKKAEQKKAEQMREEKKKQAIPQIEALMKEVERIKKEVGMT